MKSPTKADALALDPSLVATHEPGSGVGLWWVVSDGSAVEHGRHRLARWAWECAYYAVRARDRVWTEADVRAELLRHRLTQSLGRSTDGTRFDVLFAVHMLRQERAGLRHYRAED